MANAAPDQKVIDIMSENQAQLIRRERALPPPDIRGMFRMHPTLRHFFHAFAANTWTLVSRQDHVAASGSLSLSPDESFIISEKIRLGSDSRKEMIRYWRGWLGRNVGIVVGSHAN